eukprot:9491936-Pyramimonas_sp.AAC.1
MEAQWGLQGIFYPLPFVLVRFRYALGLLAVSHTASFTCEVKPHVQSFPIYIRIHLTPPTRCMDNER